MFMASFTLIKIGWKVHQEPHTIQPMKKVIQLFFFSTSLRFFLSIRTTRVAADTKSNHNGRTLHVWSYLSCLNKQWNQLWNIEKINWASVQQQTTMKSSLSVSTTLFIAEDLYLTQWANRQKNSLKECVFVNWALKTVPYCQKYTLTDSFYGDFTHWECL